MNRAIQRLQAEIDNIKNQVGQALLAPPAPWGMQGWPAEATLRMRSRRFPLSRPKLVPLFQTPL